MTEVLDRIAPPLYVPNIYIQPADIVEVTPPRHIANLDAVDRAIGWRGQADLANQFSYIKPEPPVVERPSHAADKLDAKVWTQAFALEQDIRYSQYKARTLGAGALYFATKGVGRVNAPGWLMTVATMNILDATHSSLLTAAGNGAMVLGWSFMATHAVNTGLKHYPYTVQAIGGNFSKTAEFVADQLPGLKPEDPQSNPAEHSAFRKAVVTRSLRGLLAQKQLSKYISTANYIGMSDEERNRLCLNTSIDAAAASAVIYGALAQVMLLLAPDNPELVTQMESDFKNPLAQWGIAGAVVGTNMLRNLARQHRAKRMSEPEEAVVLAVPAEALAF